MFAVKLVDMTDDTTVQGDPVRAWFAHLPRKQDRVMLPGGSDLYRVVSVVLHPVLDPNSRPGSPTVFVKRVDQDGRSPLT